MTSILPLRCAVLVKLVFGADGSIRKGIGQQIYNTFEMIARVLESAKLNFGHVICLDSFHVVHEHMEAFIQERAKFIQKPYPTWTAFGVTGLALPEAKVEIKVSARPEDETSVRVSLSDKSDNRLTPFFVCSASCPGI